MNIGTARIILIVFSICWFGLVLMMLFGAVAGECFDKADSACWSAKEYAPALLLWRGLAIELLAVVIYLLFSRRRTN